MTRHEQGKKKGLHREKKDSRRSTVVPIRAGMGRATLKTEALTDMGNARRFTINYGADLRFCHSWNKWLIWDGVRWQKDEDGEVFRRAKKTASSISKEAECSNEMDKVLKHATRTQSQRALYAMVALATTEKEIAVTAAELDSDNWMMNVQNGTLNLRDGTHYPHRKEDLLTMLAPVEYHPDAVCPTWEEFLSRIMGGNDNLVRFIQRAIGYALTGDVSEQALFFLYGTGANGKSTLLNTIQDMLGDYATQAAPSLLIAKHGDSHPTEIADLQGRRFVVAAEVDEGKRMAEALVKQMTGGDRLKARFMRQDFFEFNPTHKLFLAANHKPTIQGTDRGIWRRMRLIPFTVAIPENEQDKRLPEKLRQELPGILNWAVQGCLAWQAEGLGIPDEVAHATAAYRSEMDVLQNFLTDCGVFDSSRKVRGGALYEAYAEWSEENGEQRRLNQRAFSVALKERGYENQRGAGGYYYWPGIGLKRDEGIEEID